MSRFRHLIRSVGRTTLGSIVLQLAVGTLAHAQLSSLTPSSAPIVGGTAGMPAPASSPFTLPGRNSLAIHKNFAGHPCISVSGSAKRQVTNPTILDQLVSATNSCPQPIKLQVCYYGSKDCILMTVNGLSTLQRTLGITSGITDFRYEYRELGS